MLSGQLAGKSACDVYHYFVGPDFKKNMVVVPKASEPMTRIVLNAFISALIEIIKYGI